jgi:hypothetical protein
MVMRVVGSPQVDEWRRIGEPEPRLGQGQQDRAFSGDIEDGLPRRLPRAADDGILSDVSVS